MANRLLNAAMRYTKAGIATMPVWPDRRKNPKITSYAEYRERLPTVEEWTRWAQRWPKANIAILTGYHIGLCALDFDDVSSYNEWSMNVSDKWENTWRVETGRGWHVYFISKGDSGQDRVFKRGTSTVLLRAKGAYVIAPPSTHYTGRSYRTVKNVLPIETQVRYILAGWEEKHKTSSGHQINRPKTPKMWGNRLNILDWIPPYNINPNRRGAMQCFCPFHDDDNPSAWVNPKENRFGCNSPGCPAHGWHDVINVIAMMTGNDNAKLMSNYRKRGNPLSFE